ncbi:hypothetical protein GH714_019101 [Hevea brasiliensis]|uniref:Uncharacterized protein n=1 Tax=Hevea brasiliensis TaxID=3981 RepID=A0A6A6MCM0_HEVBR|nr:hypothetical protein GH714_019101 [Hevea brasiliensis]
MNFGKNLVSEFDEQSNIATSAGQLEAGLARNQMPQVLDEISFSKRISRRKVNKRMPQVIGVVTRQSKKSKRVGAKSNKQTSISSEKHSEIVRNGSTFERSLHDMLDGCHESALTGSGSVKKRNLPEEFATLVPIARRTRLSLVASQLKSAENVCSGTGEETNSTIEISALRRNKAGASVKAAKLLDAKGKSSELVSRKFGQRKNFKSKLTTMSNGISCPRLRSCRQKSVSLMNQTTWMLSPRHLPVLLS